MELCARGFSQVLLSEDFIFLMLFLGEKHGGGIHVTIFLKLEFHSFILRDHMKRDTLLQTRHRTLHKPGHLLHFPLMQSLWLYGHG